MSAVKDQQYPPETGEWPDFGIQSRLLVEARKTSANARLCLQHRNWQGAIGNWAGAGVGSSIDFRDHRPYLPGDDPRYIDWAAYARSGHYIMKLYREEVSPKLDIIVDLSRSMMWVEPKRDRTFETLYFCLESGMALGASVRMFGVCGNQFHAFPIESVHAGKVRPPAFDPGNAAPEISTLPLQSGSLRLFISDLLYDRAPSDFVRSLVSNRGRASILTPYLPDEENPDWHGNVELIDCESGGSRRQYVDGDVLGRYRSAYRRHFAAWRDAAHRYDARLARMNCLHPFAAGLREEGFTNGVVEAWT